MEFHCGFLQGRPPTHTPNIRVRATIAHCEIPADVPADLQSDSAPQYEIYDCSQIAITCVPGIKVPSDSQCALHPECRKGLYSHIATDALVMTSGAHDQNAGSASNRKLRDHQNSGKSLIAHCEIIAVCLFCHLRDSRVGVGVCPFESMHWLMTSGTHDQNTGSASNRKLRDRHGLLIPLTFAIVPAYGVTVATLYGLADHQRHKHTQNSRKGFNRTLRYRPHLPICLLIAITSSMEPIYMVQLSSQLSPLSNQLRIPNSQPEPPPHSSLYYTQPTSHYHRTPHRLIIAHNDSPPPPITIPSSPATNRRLASPSTSLYFAVSTDLSGARIQLPTLPSILDPISSSCSALLTGTGLPISLSAPQPALPTDLALMAVGSSESSACLFPGNPLSLRSLASVGDPPPTPRASTSQSRDLGVGPSRRPDGADPLQQALEDFAGENEGVWGELQRIVPSPDRSRLQELRDLQSELLSSLEQRLQQQLLAATPNVSTSTTTPEGTPPLI
ncbi:hypothetical protein PSTT_05399 [Puccinia striiformis]|uniref:Uncharacterized protein n=1 Tax=Puccinia striiformis TaxID=27350 RepID=A0A2S4VNS4_9BASI|nr:hypothetical protein PSTT_05399 [Puccinia striiformis]